MNMKVSVFALLMATAMASATAVADNQKTIDAKADSALAKRGVEIGGSIRAVAQRSSFDTDQDPSGMNKMPDVERNEFVSADIDFRFRPYESVRANVMMRLGGGMQEYFAAASKTLAVEWINVEGNVGNSFYWVAGDFRQQCRCCYCEESRNCYGNGKNNIRQKRQLHYQSKHCQGN